MKIKPYNITKAKTRTQYYFNDYTRNLWIYSEKLKEEIDRCSFSGYSEADIEVILFNEMESKSMVAKLEELYSAAGYVTDIQNLIYPNGQTGGYRLVVRW